jgi:hypothetical protein
MDDILCFVLGIVEPIFEFLLGIFGFLFPEGTTIYTLFPFLGEVECQ